MKRQLPEFANEYFSIDNYGLEGRTLIVSGSWDRHIESALQEFDVDSVALNYALGYNERNLDFLHAGLNIRKLFILSRTTEDLSPVYRLASSLEHLSVEVSTKVKLDLARLPLIQSISADWPLIRDSLSQVENLQSAFIFLYSEPDLRALGVHLGLESLRFKQSPRVQSLAGLDFFPKLRSLSIFGGRRFADMSQLEAFHPNQIKEIQIESCKTISSLESLHSCEGLTFLNISNLGSVASLVPLRNLKSLERLYAYESTMVIDGDLSPLAELSHLRQLKMMNRKSYTPSVAEIMQMLGASE
ncbi:hypothetical protein [Subtercola vilae]|uniref:Leucine-rich repeat domain-containing protein n=1 Tax=Subtercola vilae TaxID=2056433 RepID=A0A4T2BC50_9MICO|nr:hypothetical protein [Subtercola vilae]TIH27061.1 hypothetical protein D4765_18710 [Subtercola vilae]